MNNITKIFLLIFFLFGSYIAFSQEVSSLELQPKKQFDHQVSIEAQFLSIGLGYNTKVNENYSIGFMGNIGLGGKYVLIRPYHFGGNIILVYRNLGIKLINHRKKFNLEYGLNFMEYFYNDFTYSDGLLFNAGIFTKSKQVQAGFQFSFGKDWTRDRTMAYTSLLIVRLNINW